VNEKNFEIGVQGGRVYHLSDASWGADVWVEAITTILTAQKDYFRRSRKI
jgi:hypothetical protein